MLRSGYHNPTRRDFTRNRKDLYALKFYNSIAIFLLYNPVRKCSTQGTNLTYYFLSLRGQ